MKQAKALIYYYASLMEDINQKKNRLQKCIDIVFLELNSILRTKYSRPYMTIL